jgi:hypothetical protein
MARPREPFPVGILAVALMLAVGRGSQADSGGSGTASVFATPQAEATTRRVVTEAVGLFAAGRIDDARRRIETAIGSSEMLASIGHYGLARVHAARGDTAAGLDALTAAAAAGFDDVAAVARDPDLAPLRLDPRFADIAAAVRANAQATERRYRERRPRPVTNGVATVAEDNTIWVPSLSRFIVAHEFPPADPEAEVSRQPGAVGDLLRQWRSEGTAAGLHGVLYDNHDDGHSVMNTGWFPELTRIEYCAAAKQARTELFGLGELDRGLQVLFVHGTPVIGNASVAQTEGPFWRSMPRVAMTNDTLMTLLADQYVSNAIYFYPEHRDHDPEADKGHGDVYPANIPYLVTSQGSSGSDRAFLDAVAATIAAFRPETRTFLVDRHLLAPTVQMILRASRTPVKGRDDYLSGIAHPPVFDAATLDVERMVRMAHDLEPGAVPPLVRLAVVSEDLGRPGIDYFDAGPAEKLFDTVSAVARVARSARFRRRMVASVAATRGPHGRQLTFVWRVLRGDPERVRIKTLDEAGTRAEILVDWHARAVQPGGELPSARVDVGVFADDGTRLSAPAFLTWYFPPNERRTYEPVPTTAASTRSDDVNGDAPQRIVKIERLPADARGSYVDPLVVTPAPWTDDYRYDDRGDLLGWTRTRPGGTKEFTADGRLVRGRDADGKPAETRAVRYVRRQAAADALPVLEEEILAPADR